MASKYRHALRGFGVALRTDDSFRVHGFATLVVIVAAMVLQVSLYEALLLGLCVAAVWAAELFNTGIERLTRVVTQQEHPGVRDTLDLCAAAVMVGALAAKVVGSVIFAARLFTG